MEVTLYLPSDKDKLCRTCIGLLEEPPTSQNLLFFENKPTQLFTLFHDLITPEISSDDGLPNVLCKNCREQLQFFMTFKEQCLKANERLKKLFFIERTSNAPEIKTSQPENSTVYKCEDYSNDEEVFCNFNKHIPLHNNDNTLTEVDVQAREDNFLTTDEDEPEIKSIIEIDEMFMSQCDEQQQYDEQKNSNQYQCNICNRVFESKLKFTIHFMQHAVLAGVSKEHFYFCKNCGELFKSKLELEEHFVKEHTNKTSVLWECSQCQETFDSESYLFKHETDEDHYNLLDHLSEDIFICPICSESCTTKNKLISHSTVHLLQNYRCKICQKLFITQESYNWHVNSHPSNGYFCDICNKHLASRSSYKTHVILVHQETNKSLFTCHVCNRKFKLQCQLNVHERIHTANKKFMCEYCGHQTINFRDLTVHMRIHTAERPYKCTYANCSRAFKSSSQRSAHVRSHLDIRRHKCQICSKSFMEKCTLKRHLLVHSDDRPYKCIVCSYTTKKKNHLSVHMKKHEKS